MIFRTLLLALFISNVAAAAPDAVDCKLTELTENTELKGTGYKLGKMQYFVDETGELKGYQLMVKEKELLWTNHLHAAADKIFYRKCVGSAAKPDWFNKGDGVYGDCAHEWFVMPAKQADPKPSSLKLPGYTFVSNGAFCGSHLAYYSVDKAKRCKGDLSAVDAIVFDLRTQKIAKRVSLACLELATDNEGHFAAPEWKKNAVVFEAEPEKQTTVSIK